jgi:hypothetical protein
MKAGCWTFCQRIALLNATLLSTVYWRTEPQDTDNICSGASMASRDRAPLSFQISCFRKLEVKAMRCPPSAQIEHKKNTKIIGLIEKTEMRDTTHRQRGDMIWYDMIWYIIIYYIYILYISWYMIWYDRWYDIWCDMIWYDRWYDIWWDMIWYMMWYDMNDMIYLTEIGLTPGGSSTVHIYTHTVHRTTQKNNT